MPWLCPDCPCDDASLAALAAAAAEEFADALAEDEAPTETSAFDADTPAVCPGETSALDAPVAEETPTVPVETDTAALSLLTLTPKLVPFTTAVKYGVST